MEWTWLLPAPEERTLDAGEEFAVALNAQIGDANYFELRVESGADLRGVIAYHNAEDPEEKNEEDFYIGREQTSFRQILDFYFENAYDKVLESVTLKNAGTERASVRVNAVGCAVKEWYGSAQVFLEKENIRLGVDMNAGGAINYLELLNARVEQVKMPDGSVEIGINYAAKDGAELMYDSVNLINEMDRGRFSSRITGLLRLRTNARSISARRGRIIPCRAATIQGLPLRLSISSFRRMKSMSKRAPWIGRKKSPPRILTWKTGIRSKTALSGCATRLRISRAGCIRTAIRNFPRFTARLRSARSSLIRGTLRLRAATSRITPASATGWDREEPIGTISPKTGRRG